jgi:hypothetical protein
MGFVEQPQTQPGLNALTAASWSAHLLIIPLISHLNACKNFLTHLLRQRNSAPVALGRILGQSMGISIDNQ